MGPVSPKVYVPALTLAAVTGADPVAPEIVVGPVAVKVKSVASAVPPLSLVMVFFNVKTGETSLLLMVQVAFWPGARTRLLPVSVPEVQDHAPAA